MPYVWGTFDTYRLKLSDLDGFLQKTFGNYEFFITVSGGARGVAIFQATNNPQVQAGYYRFWVPRVLSDVRQRVPIIMHTLYLSLPRQKRTSLLIFALKTRDDKVLHGEDIGGAWWPTLHKSLKLPVSPFSNQGTL
jgi:hypothetical protein